MSEQVGVVTSGAVAVVTVDNPPVNALSDGVLEALGDAAAVIGADPELRAVVLTGAGGKAFLAGADLGELGAVLGEREWVERHTALTRSVLGAWARLPQPTIAAVMAPAIGGGLEVALVCDLIVSDPGARFGFPEVRLGLIPGAGGTQRLPLRIPPTLAKRLLLFGESIEAEEAHRLGLVSTVSAPGAALAEALAQAERLAALPALAVQAIKAVTSHEEGLETGLEREHERFVAAFLSQDVHEGVRAFFERRTPSFVHR